MTVLMAGLGNVFRSDCFGVEVIRRLAAEGGSRKTTPRSRR
jgi:Ni,Fe-hydrogenase maturation factor